MLELKYVFVFPAWAGMNRTIKNLAQSTSSVPRVGGDEPVMPSVTLLIWRCSPRGRG
uniref:Uncharacterized protein n=1 Tax=blood disease bacterium R229 TaxID=741978 RepID=G2ZU56_9RALS|nr:conserved hypothetical protein [blood disease bacterium R229]